MSHGLTMTSTFDSCTDDSHCYNDNHDGTERRELIGRSCSGHEKLGMCLDGWNAVSSQTTHSTTVPDTILVAGPFSVKTMFTPLLVQQWQGVTWMTQCERLPDWCDTAAWRGDKTRVCHEATLPTISTWHLQCVLRGVQSERIPDWCDTACHRDKPTQGGSVTHQATLSTFSICNLSSWHANYVGPQDIWISFWTIDKQRFYVLFPTDCRTQVPNKSFPNPYTS